MTRIYPDEKSFLEKLDTSMQNRLTADATNAVMTVKAPKLIEVPYLLSERVLHIWITKCLADINESVGAREKMSIRSIDDLVTVIKNEYRFLKVSEFMLFCRWFKVGHFGNLYGCVDPMLITKALRKFVSEDIVRIREEHEAKVRDGMIDERYKDVITYEEFVRLHPDKAGLIEKLKNFLNDEQEEEKGDGNKQAYMAQAGV